MTSIPGRVWRALFPRPAIAAAPVSRLAYVESGNQWYRPVLAGTSTLGPLVQGSAAVRRARGILERLECDEYHRFVLNFYRCGLETCGDAWAHADLYTTLAGLSAVLQPRRYLEIGVRRGHSMAMVLSQAPSCQPVGFDLWIENYAGLRNPGKEFVREQLGRVGFTGDVAFVDGDSATTVPDYFRAHPDLYFDMITVDGDHSRRGATRDLEHVLPRVAVGGVLAFDDLSNPSHPELREVWQDTVASNPSFATWAFDEVGFGVAFAVRMR